MNERAETLKTSASKLGLSVAQVENLDTLRDHPAFAAASRGLVLLADPSPDGALAGEAISFAQAKHEKAYLLYVCDQIAPDAYKQLLRSRSGEWCRWDGLPQELVDVFQRLVGIEPAERTAKIIGFLPSKGGVGNTTLAVETSVLLASRSKRSGRRIAVLDLNLQGGTLADSLDLEARFDLRELTDRPERLDDHLIDVFVSPYSDGLDVFASPSRRTDAAPSDPQMIFSVLDLMASRYDLILLDIPNQNLPWIENLLLGSDAVLVTGEGNVPALKQLAAVLDHLDALSVEPAKIAIAVNRCDADLFGRIARRADLLRALPRRRVYFIRHHVAALVDANNAGRPLLELSPGSRVTKDVRQLADWIEDTIDPPALGDGAKQKKRT